MDCPPDPRPGAQRRTTARAVVAALVAVATSGLVSAPAAQAVTYSPAAVLLSGSPLTDADGVDAVAGATYVCDGAARKLFKLDAGGLVVATADLSASTTPASAVTLSASAADIAVGAAKVYIADTGNHRVVSVPLLTTGTTTPALALEMGTGTAGGTFDGNVATSQLSSPKGLTVVTSGSTDVLYVADTGHHEVIRRSGTALTIVAGNGQAPPASPGPVQLQLPSDVAVDPSGTLYVSDTGYDRVVSVSASQLTTVASVTAPGPLAASAGTLAVGSSSGIKAVALPGGAVTDLAAGTTASGIDISAAGVVVATQAAGPSSKVLTISPTAAPDAAPVISGPTALSAAKGSTLSVPFTATGYPAPAWSLLESSTGAPALTIDPATGVLSGTLATSGTFTYRVQAANTLGRPNQVLTLTVGSVPATVSAKPVAVAAQGSATVTWAAPTASTAAGEGITGYVLTPYAGGAAGTPKTLSPSTLSTTLTGLTAGTSYTFTVAATNAFGTGVASAASAAVVPYGGVTQPPAGLTRVQGGNRVMTAVATSRQLFPGAGSARAVVIASSTSFADSLAGARLASAVGAPLLLTDPLALNTEVAGEVARVLAVPPATTASTTAGPGLAAADATGAVKPTTTGTVYLLGGTTAVSADVEAAVKAVNAKYSVTRVSGADRYETATKIAAQVAVDDPVAGAPLYVASGRDYPDGLAVAALAARTGGVVLLTDGPTMPASTLTYLQKFDPNSELLVAVGGPAARATAGHGADRALVGTDRYDTARRVAERFTAPAGSARVTAMGLATGDNWPDALAGAAAMGNLRGPLLLTPSASLSPSVAPAVTAASSAGRPSSALVFGGPTVVSASTSSAFGALVSG